VPDTTALSLSGSKKTAAEIQAYLANSVLRLFLSTFVPSPTSLLSDFVAAEANFDGYESQTLAAWEAPVLAGTGYITYGPQTTWLWSSSGSDVGNIIGGMFLVGSDGTLINYTTFNPFLSMTGPDMAIVRTPAIAFPAG